MRDQVGSFEESQPPEFRQALEIAQGFARQAKGTAPVRYGFVRRQAASDPLPPMIRLLRGGTGGRGSSSGNVRIGLYLSLLWTVRDDPTLSYPARFWAALLGLKEPETAGARRIKRALRWLHENDLIRLESARGHDAKIQMLEDTGTGRRYELPGATYQRLRQAKRSLADPHRYIQLPRELWTNGWISVLSGPALVMLLVLFVESGKDINSSNPRWIWLSPAMAEERYGLSEDTRLKGAKELADLDLITLSRQQAPTSAYEFRRGRNSHQLQLPVLEGRFAGETAQDAYARQSRLKPLPQP